MGEVVIVFHSENAILTARLDKIVQVYPGLAVSGKTRTVFIVPGTSVEQSSSNAPDQGGRLRLNHARPIGRDGPHLASICGDADWNDYEVYYLILGTAQPHPPQNAD